MIKTKTLNESGPEKIVDFIINYRFREHTTFQFLSQQCIQPLNIEFTSKYGCLCPSAINQVQELISNIYSLS